MFVKNAALLFGLLFMIYSLLGLSSQLAESKLDASSFTTTTDTKTTGFKTVSFREKKSTTSRKSTNETVLYGTASYYAFKFEGRRTAAGEVFEHKKMTAACNALPLGTWIKVTNLINGQSVIVKTNDRLAKKTSRLVDLTMAATKRLGFKNAGLTRVKVEVIPKAEIDG